MKHFIAFKNLNSTKKVLRFSVYHIAHNLPVKVMEVSVKVDSVNPPKVLIVNNLTSKEYIKGMYDEFQLDILD